MSETDLSKAIRAALERVPGVVSVTRIQSGTLSIGARFVHCAPAGTPDLLVLLTRGRAVFVECKQPGKDLSDDQCAWANKHEKAGHRVIVAHSTIEAVNGVIGRRVSS